MNTRTQRDVVREEKERGRKGLKDWLVCISVRKPGMLDDVEHTHTHTHTHTHNSMLYIVASGICWQDEKKEGVASRHNSDDGSAGVIFGLLACWVVQAPCSR